MYIAQVQFHSKRVSAMQRVLLPSVGDNTRATMSRASQQVRAPVGCLVDNGGVVIGHACPPAKNFLRVVQLALATRN